MSRRQVVHRIVHRSSFIVLVVVLVLVLESGRAE
jgi:hypothetical protein